MRKSQIKEIYDKYLREKCSMTLYYKRIKQGVDPFKALLPAPPKEFAVRSKLYRKELEWYKKQPQPKPPREKFYGRIQKGRKKEEAILIQPPTHERKSKIQKDIYVKAYTVKEQRFKPDNFEIRITYSQEEAEVFKKEYERMIQETEDKWNLTDDIVEATELRKRLDKLIQEYSIFICYNQKQNESL